MSDSFTVLNTGTGGDQIDEESLTVSGQTVRRQRIEVCGAAAAEIARILNTAPVGTEYSLVVRPITVSSTFTTGRKSGIGTTPVQVTTSSVTAINGVQIKAADTNTDKVYVGISGVTADTADATDGYPLAPGDALLVPVSNANAVYVVASSGSQKVFWVVQ